MLKIRLLLFLILSFIFISLKSIPVPHPEYVNIPVPYPEYIKWRAQPRDFIISLFRGVLGREPQAEWHISNLAFILKSDPESRLKMFWTMVSTEEYQASRWAKQKKEYQVY